MKESLQWYDTVGIVGGQLFVVCVLLALAYTIFLIVTDGRPNSKDVEEAMNEYQDRKRPKPTPRDPDDQGFFDKVEEAQNDFS